MSQWNIYQEYLAWPVRMLWTENCCYFQQCCSCYVCGLRKGTASLCPCPYIVNCEARSGGIRIHPVAFLVRTPGSDLGFAKNQRFHLPLVRLKMAKITLGSQRQGEWCSSSDGCFLAIGRRQRGLKAQIKTRLCERAVCFLPSRIGAATSVCGSLGLCKYFPPLWFWT